jgi:hypothetical protein
VAPSQLSRQKNFPLGNTVGKWNNPIRSVQTLLTGHGDSSPISLGLTLILMKESVMPEIKLSVLRGLVEFVGKGELPAPLVYGLLIILVAIALRILLRPPRRH